MPFPTDYVSFLTQYAQQLLDFRAIPKDDK